MGMGIALIGVITYITIGVLICAALSVMVASAADEKDKAYWYSLLLGWPVVIILTVISKIRE